MRNILMLGLMLLFVIISQAQFKTADLQATGLTCAMCNNAINKAIQTLPFVTSVKSDIKNSSFHIVLKEDKDTDIDAIKKKVEDAGFFVGSLTLTGNFHDLSIAKDKHVEIGKEYFHFLNATDQVLNGEKTITVVDKNFVSAKQFKKVKAETTMNCINTGKAESCCSGEGIPADARVYHVTI